MFGSTAQFATGAVDDAEWVYVALSPQSGFVMEPVEEDPEHSSQSSTARKIPTTFCKSSPTIPKCRSIALETSSDPIQPNLFFGAPSGPESRPVQGRGNGADKARWRCSSIIELSSDNHPVNGSMNTVLDTVWTTIEDDINNSLSEEIRLKKNRIVVAKPDKPFRRLGKGFINRRVVLIDYADEIKALHA